MLEFLYPPLYPPRRKTQAPWTTPGLPSLPTKKPLSTRERGLMEENLFIVFIYHRDMYGIFNNHISY
jgi:hypothetical protein